MTISPSPELDAAWKAFLDSLPPDAPRPTAYTAWSFGDTPEMADKLGALVVEGIKTATASLLWEYEFDGEPLPKPGDHSIILDSKRKPLCIVKTSEVCILPFDRVDEQFAYDEGEGDRSLAFWRQAHWQVFSRTCARIGRQPIETMPVVCERFQLVWKPAASFMLAAPPPPRAELVRFCMRCGNAMEHREESGRIRPVCPRCGFVHYFAPQVAAVAIVTRGDGRLLLVKRGEDPGKGRWGLPGGFVEMGETIETALRREILEETGFQVELGAFVGVWSFFNEVKHISGAAFVYVVHVVAGELTLASDSVAAEWVTCQEALNADLAFETHRAAIQAWERCAG